MKIERSNILELIGTGKNKYHSCVITSYSIDLAFFEQLILPKLRGAGITNINLFVDASMQEKYLASHLGNSIKKFNANYSITPVSISGAFHPKMLFLAGKDKGYLAVGSGNITSSGLLYNDEIWSSFYTAKERLKAQPIFKSAWQYIQSLSSHSLGINLTKISWIAQHSQWISDLEDSQHSKATIKDSEYSLFYTKHSKSLYSEVISTLSRKPKSIKIIAPYYNRSGAFLQKLIDDLAPEQVHCVVDISNGILPVEFQSNICQFSDWKDVVSTDNSKSIQRLHAKIIQIEYDDETVFVLGSANATLEAYGISNRAFKNEEAVITIRSSEKAKDFVKELGINIPEKGALDLKTTVNIESDTLEVSSDLLKIKHTELNDDIVTISLDKKIPEDCLLKTFDSNNTLLEKIDVSLNSKTIQTSLKVTESIFKVGLYSLVTVERLSTFGLIQNVNALQKSNPDERLARLQSFEHLDIFSSLNYELVLDFLDQEQVFKDSTASQAPITIKLDDAEDDGEIISQSEYNKNASLNLDEQISSENITSMVEEFLDVLKIRDNPEELSDNAEELATEAGDDGMDEETSLQHTQTFISASEGRRISRKIEKTIKSIFTLIHNREVNNIPQDSKSLNSLFVGFHILLHFWDEIYVEELSQVKVRYKQLDDLHLLERKFGLERLESQIDSSNYEVSYYIDYSKLNKFQILLENSDNDFQLIGHPSEPIGFEYTILSERYIQDFKTKSWLFDFLDLGLSQIMIAIKSKQLELNENQKVKLVTLSNRLLNKITWNTKFYHWKKLLLLNLNDIINSESIDTIKLPSEERYHSYITFKHRQNNSLINVKDVSPQIIGKIIYSKVMGFGTVRKTLRDAKLEFYSPLFLKNFKEDEFGIYKEVYISKKVKVLD